MYLPSIINLDGQNAILFALVVQRHCFSPPALDINLPCTTFPFHQNHDHPLPLGPHPFPRNHLLSTGSLLHHPVQLMRLPCSPFSYFHPHRKTRRLIYGPSPSKTILLQEWECNLPFNIAPLGGKGGCVLGYDLFAFTGLLSRFPPQPTTMVTQPSLVITSLPLSFHQHSLYPHPTPGP